VVGSFASIGSVGSVGSAFSVGSAGSIGSALSAGSSRSVLSAGRADSVMDEPDPRAGAIAAAVLAGTAACIAWWALRRD
jgi:hypothetical protein